MSENIKGLALFAVCTLLSFLVTVPASRNALLKLQNRDTRTVLAILQYAHENSKYQVIKLRVGLDIFIEIYQQADSGELTLLKRFTWRDSRDAHFSSETTYSNLFLANLDEDRQSEIIAPLLDENLVSHFSVIKFDKDSRTFSQFDSSDF